MPPVTHPAPATFTLTSDVPGTRQVVLPWGPHDTPEHPPESGSLSPEYAHTGQEEAAPGMAPLGTAPPGTAPPGTAPPACAEWARHTLQVAARRPQPGIPQAAALLCADRPGTWAGGMLCFHGSC